MTTTTTNVDQVSPKQAASEARMVTAGIERYYRKQNKSIESGQLGKAENNLLESSLSNVATYIAKMVSDQKALKGSSGKTPSWVLPLSLIDPLKAASVVIQAVFRGVSNQQDVRKTAIDVAANISLEVWSEELKQESPELFDRLSAMAIKNHDSLKYRKQAVTAVAAKEDFAFVPWDTDYAVIVGGALINAALLSSTYFEILDIAKGTKETKKILALTEETLRTIDTMNIQYSLLRPVYLPMLTPPVPWASMNTGCYHNKALTAGVSFVKTFEVNAIKAIKKAFADGSINPVRDAVNAIQAVPLRTNQGVLDALVYCWENRISVSGLPTMEAFAVPAKVEPLRWQIMPHQEQKLHRKTKQNALLKNRAMVSEWLQLQQDIGVAVEFSTASEFYLPHSLDFRGRVYPIPSFNHQRGDHIRSLFEFANGKAIGDTGAYWLAVHIANCGDFDRVSKATFDARNEWVLANSEAITAIGNDPLGTIEEWSCADKPFSYLAGCIEWAGFMREGAKWVSRLPIALDGSNSGLQHYSAALRSPEGALVNLTPSEKPQDVYQAVASICLETVRLDSADYGEKQEVAQKWLAFGVSRSVVKRSVMTFAYSSEKFGFKNQLLEDLMEPLKDKVLKQEIECHPFGRDEGNAAALYMAGLIWDGVHSIVSKAAEGMKFLQKCSSALAHESKPVTWTTPLGLPVVNLYQEFETKTVELFLHDRKVTVAEMTNKDKLTKDGDVLKRVQMILRTKPTGRVLKPKMKSTIAPNFIHSLDAAHLQSVANAAVAVGITDMLLIHDSFSTYACDTKKYQDVIKQAFVDMYANNDVFAQFHEKVITQITPENLDKVPAVPFHGTLDIQDVLKSNYCFS